MRFYLNYKFVSLVLPCFTIKYFNYAKKKRNTYIIGWTRR